MLLSDHETYEIYEKRSLHSPRATISAAPIPPQRVTSQNFPLNETPASRNHTRPSWGVSRFNDNNANNNDDIGRNGNTNQLPVNEQSHKNRAQFIAVPTDDDTTNDNSPRIGFKIINQKVPMPWIIAAAVGIPMFIIISSFLAVWLQEMGLI